MNKIRKLVSKERIVEIYYDSAKEVIIAIMYMDGFKTTSHVEMINYLREKYPEIGQVRIALLDELRQKRNAISYYGESIGESFLAQKEEEIKDAIEEIKKKAKSKL
jgi:GTP cyclohydrolase III